MVIGGGNEPLDSQIGRLATYIMQEVPGEPSQSEGAVDCAIRVLRTLQSDVRQLRQRTVELERHNGDMSGRLDQLASVVRRAHDHALAGDPEVVNPYPDGMPEATAWQWGWAWGALEAADCRRYKEQMEVSDALQSVGVPEVVPVGADATAGRPLSTTERIRWLAGTAKRLDGQRQPHPGFPLGFCKANPDGKACHDRTCEARVGCTRYVEGGRSSNLPNPEALPVGYALRVYEMVAGVKGSVMKLDPLATEFWRPSVGKPVVGASMRCSFCGKAVREVKRLVACVKPGAHICNECVDQCVEMMAKEG